MADFTRPSSTSARGLVAVALVPGLTNFGSFSSSPSPFPPSGGERTGKRGQGEQEGRGRKKEGGKGRKKEGGKGAREREEVRQELGRLGLH